MARECKGVIVEWRKEADEGFPPFFCGVNANSKGIQMFLVVGGYARDHRSPPSKIRRST